MLATIISTNLILNVLSLALKHPLSLGASLLMQTISVSLITGSLNMNLWFSYILFLVMIGGMLILFMYMTSVASNEKFKPNMYLTSLIMITPITTYMILPYSNKIVNNELLHFNKYIELNMTFNKFINMPLNNVLMLTILYLLIVLIATVKITKFKQGPLRSMN